MYISQRNTYQHLSQARRKKSYKEVRTTTCRTKLNDPNLGAALYHYANDENNPARLANPLKERIKLSDDALALWQVHEPEPAQYPILLANVAAAPAERFVRNRQNWDVQQALAPRYAKTLQWYITITAEAILQTAQTRAQDAVTFSGITDEEHRRTDFDPADRLETTRPTVTRIAMRKSRASSLHSNYSTASLRSRRIFRFPFLRPSVLPADLYYLQSVQLLQITRMLKMTALAVKPAGTRSVDYIGCLLQLHGPVYF
ncbi:hypothetical protein BJ912DRAFT_925692 [Pholiota molesta]|nr:hypothetical protein BJ912DRAFT_925692 [Pholiota molesta]